jgi:hypothetical protein
MWRASKQHCRGRHSGRHDRSCKGRKVTAATTTAAVVGGAGGSGYFGEQCTAATVIGRVTYLGSASVGCPHLVVVVGSTHSSEHVGRVPAAVIGVAGHFGECHPPLSLLSFSLSSPRRHHCSCSAPSCVGGVGRWCWLGSGTQGCTRLGHCDCQRINGSRGRGKRRGHTG